MEKLGNLFSLWSIFISKTCCCDVNVWWRECRFDISSKKHHRAYQFCSAVLSKWHRLDEIDGFSLDSFTKHLQPRHLSTHLRMTQEHHFLFHSHFFLWGFSFTHESSLPCEFTVSIASLWYQRDFISTKEPNVCSPLPLACEHPEINVV